MWWLEVGSDGTLWWYVHGRTRNRRCRASRRGQTQMVQAKVRQPGRRMSAHATACRAIARSLQLIQRQVASQRLVPIARLTVRRRSGASTQCDHAPRRRSTKRKEHRNPIATNGWIESFANVTLGAASASTSLHARSLLPVPSGARRAALLSRLATRTGCTETVCRSAPKSRSDTGGAARPSTPRARDSRTRSLDRSMMRKGAPNKSSCAASVSPVGPAPTIKTSGFTRLANRGRVDHTSRGNQFRLNASHCMYSGRPARFPNFVQETTMRSPLTATGLMLATTVAAAQSKSMDDE